MKRKLRLKRWVKWLIVGIILLTLINLLEKSDREFVNNCMANGYSETYCIAHK